ncbi:MAG: autotransporter domain-containing protein [Advenella sp.]
MVINGSASNTSAVIRADSNDAIAQHIDKVTTNSVQSVLGAELNHSFEDQSSLRFRARYLHEFNNQPEVGAGFVAGGSSFNLKGDDLARNSVELGVAYRSMVRGWPVFHGGLRCRVKKTLYLA